MKKRIFHMFLTIALLLPIQIYAKVLVITHNYNRPEFISLQLNCFNKFLEDDFEYVVFNDAVDQNFINNINITCKQLGVQCIRVPQEGRPTAPAAAKDAFKTSIRHAQALQFSMNVIASQHDDIVMLIDNDINSLFKEEPSSIEDHNNKHLQRGLSDFM